MIPIEKIILWALGILTLAGAMAPLPALAHGERATEPYIRTRTIQWYDVQWSAQDIKVNETVTVSGKFHLMADWPDAVTKPDLVFMSNATPGAVLTRVESYINDVPARQSLKNLQIGRDYTFKMVMKGRIPGRWHFHPMLNVSGAGPIVGPGSWVQVSGNAADFRHAVTTIDGTHIEDTQNYGVARAQMWQTGYIVLALAWIIWWLRRPLLIPRWMAVQKGLDDLLITKMDDKVAAGVLVLILVVVIAGYKSVTAAYPRLVPLQAGSLHTPPLPETPKLVAVKFQKAEYDVPGRSLRMNIEVTNNATHPVRLGEFMTASLRFVNNGLPPAVGAVDPAYPKELLPASGLVVAEDTPLAPGETRIVKLDATDAAWELERLVGFLTNVDSRVGALLFFYDDKGQRHINSVAGPILPVFKKTI
ncbi:MAG: bacterial ammonia monooxygenase, subunit AmoB [Burkholderiales bacterium]